MNFQYLVGSNIFKPKNYYTEQSRLHNQEKLFYSIRIRISAIVAPWQMAVAGFWISSGQFYEGRWCHGAILRYGSTIHRPVCQIFVSPPWSAIDI